MVCDGGDDGGVLFVWGIERVFLSHKGSRGGRDVKEKNLNRATADLGYQERQSLMEDKEKSGVAPSANKDAITPFVTAVSRENSSTQEANLVKAGHDNLHDVDVGETPRRLEFSYFIYIGGNEIDVVGSVESVRAISESSMNGLNAMPENGPWFIRNHLLILKKWNPDVNLLKEDVGNVPVWVKLHGVLVTTFRKEGLSSIATKLAMPKLNWEGFDTCTVRVEYEWKPPRHACCKVFGHIQEKCPKYLGLGVAKNLKKPSQALRGVSVGPTVGFKLAKEYRTICKKHTANTSFNDETNYPFLIACRYEHLMLLFYASALFVLSKALRSLKAGGSILDELCCVLAVPLRDLADFVNEYDIALCYDPKLPFSNATALDALKGYIPLYFSLFSIDLPEPIIYLVGLTDSWEHAPSIPSILIDGEGLKKRCSITEALKKEDTIVRSDSKKKNPKGSTRMSERGSVPPFSVTSPKGVDKHPWVLARYIRNLANGVESLDPDKLGFLTFDELVDVYDINAFQMAMVGNMMTNESRILSQCHSTLKNDLVSLNSKKSLLEHEMSKLEEKSEEDYVLTSQIEAAKLEKSKLVKYFLPLAVKKDLKDVQDYHPAAKKIFDEATEALYKLDFPYISLLVENVGLSFGKLASL
uniref:Uncharacterized protein n=1 Tax=Tanacetum cinerariifolium TaxID=118510 RepID=A0A6L2LPC0_TANCI|nr:hypothetical protein [Tanacetum cinerariifolium]